MNNKVNGYIYWTPRILSILLIIFISIFSFDVIEPGLSLGQIVLGLFMHNIPGIILLVVLIISWKYEIVGGIAYLLAGCMYITLNIITSYKSGFQDFAWSLIIAIPTFMIGILFLMNWFNKKRL